MRNRLAASALSLVLSACANTAPVINSNENPQRTHLDALSAPLKKRIAYIMNMAHELYCPTVIGELDFALRGGGAQPLLKAFGEECVFRKGCSAIYSIKDRDAESVHLLVTETATDIDRSSGTTSVLVHITPSFDLEALGAKPTTDRILSALKTHLPEGTPAASAASCLLP